MSYFNKKFDVLNIKLTPYGRHLLQNGKLMPKYYAFFDDDIIYDVSAIGATEKNSSVKARILDETPVLRPHYSFKTVEDLVGKDQPFPTTQHDKVKRPAADERSKFLQYSLGTSDPTKVNAPAWNVFALQNEILSSAIQLSSSTFQNVNIPQLEFEINYTMSVENINNDPPSRGMENTPNQQVGDVMKDGTYIRVEEEQVLLYILEKNGFLYGDCLNLEVFAYEVTASATAQQGFTEELVPLSFVKRHDQVLNGMLVSEEPNTFESLTSPVTPQNVEYYFDCRLDKEIPLKDLCEGINKIKGSGALVDFDIECPDDISVEGSSIYSRKITDREDC